jgi:aspartate/methionine/tyrosine aminotransferase
MEQIFAIRTEPHIDALTMPENLRIGQMIARQRNACSLAGCNERYYNFALGQSPFPVPPALAKALASAADRGEYAAAEGIDLLRTAVAAFYQRHFGLAVGPDRVFVGNGTKELIYIIFSSLDAVAVIPSPSWVGYAPILKLIGRPYLTLPPERERGFRINPEALGAALASDPDRRHILVLNNPNNPTGALYSRSELEEIAAVCREYGCLVLADEVYALTTYTFEHFTSMAAVYPEGTLVTGGLSKDRSAPGYRLGVCILPEGGPENLIADMAAIAATMYTAVSTPVQMAAVTAYSPNLEIEEYIRTVRAIHGIMCRYVSRAFAMIEGVAATKPEGGFYFLADFNALADRLHRAGVAQSNDLSTAMLAHPYHVATVSGDAVMLPPDNFAARIACVDYDGAAALDLYRKDRPKTSLDEVAFVNEAAPNMVAGVTAVRKFVGDLKKR